MRGSAAVTIFGVLTALGSAGAGCVGEDPGMPDEPPTDASAEAASVSSTAPPPDADVPQHAATPPTTDAAPPAFTPAALDERNALALWLEATSDTLTIDSGGVALWSDRSKNKNDAINNATTPTAVRPKLAPAAVNGHDAVAFGTEAVLTIADNATLQFGLDEVAMFAVAKYTGLPGRGFFFSKATWEPVRGADALKYLHGPQWLVDNGDADGGTALAPTGHVDPTYGAQWNGSVFDDGQFHLVGFRRASGDKFTLLVDAQHVQAFKLNFADASEPGQDVQIGAVHLGSFKPPVDFEIAELVVVHSASALVGDQTVTDITRYLARKYQLPSP